MPELRLLTVTASITAAIAASITAAVVAAVAATIAVAINCRYSICISSFWEYSVRCANVTIFTLLFPLAAVCCRCRRLRARMHRA
ncbi:hypothetical protein LJC08_04420 [Methanimicrococcus sp. OttesenSCG-928-J09]|nr:hypothetical protein [Methanimicrococcus sp. OttesenSCG-928-J09]